MTYYHVQEVTSSRALVIEEEAIAGKDTVGLPVVDDNPVGVEFSGGWEGRVKSREWWREGAREGGREKDGGKE